MDQIKSSVNLIKTVSPERFQEEFRKMFEKCHQVWVGTSERNRNTQKLFQVVTHSQWNMINLIRKVSTFLGFYSEDTNQKTFRVR